MRSYKMIVGLAIVGLGSIFAPVAPSVVSASADCIRYVGQTRGVSADISVQVNYGRGGNSYTPISSQIGRSQQAGDYMPFEGNVNIGSSIGASQQSSLGAGGISASGSVTAGSIYGVGSGSGRAGSNFQVTFDVASAMSYTFTANLSGRSDAGSVGNPMAAVSLTGASGTNLFAPIQTVDLANFSSSGALLPGAYSLSLSAEAGGDGLSRASEDYAISLQTAAPVVSMGVPLTEAAPAPVPLPPAYMSAAVILAMLGVAGFIRRRWDRWVVAALAC